MSQETLTRLELISIFLRFGVLTVGTFLTVKWIFSRIDPTKAQKKSAIKRVWITLVV